MDELQDAIEDAQYVNAIACVDEGPRPMLPWDFPTDEQLAEWKRTRQRSMARRRQQQRESMAAQQSQSFGVGGLGRPGPAPVEREASLASVGTAVSASSAVSGNGGAARPSPPGGILESCEYVCSQPLGFFVFSQYLKDVRKDYLRINFVEDVILYRRIRGAQNREDKARKLATTYLTTPLVISPPASADMASSGGGGAGAGAGAGGALSSSGAGEELFVQSSRTPTQSAHSDKSSGGDGDDSSAATGSGSRRKSKLRGPGASALSKQSGRDESVTSEVLTTETELVIQSPPVPVAKIPPCKEIVELDLCRPPTPARSPAMTPDEREAEDAKLIRQIDRNLDLKCGRCLIGVDGPALTTCVKRALGGIPEALQGPSASDSPPASLKDDARREQRISDLEDTDEKDGENDGEEGEGGEEGTDGDDNSSEEEKMPEEGGTTTDEEEEEEVLSTKLGARDIFDTLELIVMAGLKRQYWSDFLKSQHYRKLLNFWWFRDRKVVEEDFFLMRVLGRGGFGLVHACKKGTSGKLYAMKVMNKKRIKVKKSEQLTMSERKALAAVDSPFVVKLSYSFQSKDDVFLILDLMTGGDLGFHLHQKGCFSKKECLYFSARIMLGLQALHDRRYVYRDLKPENVLVADDGRVKISDLGLAAKITPTLHGAAGTRGYWAPEMLRRDSRGKRMPYGHSVDWFSFGCVLMEFISGVNPFRSEAALKFGLQEGMTSKEKAIDCATMKMEPKFDPVKFDHDSADLCRRLLDKNEKHRLGINGCEEIMVHPYYRDLNWEAIVSDRMKPPFIPAKDVNAASQSEIGTFAEDKTYNETVMQQKDEEVYKDWDWTNPAAFDAEVIEFLIHERRLGEPLLPMEPMNPCCCSVL